MASTFANLTRKAADKIEQLGEKNKQQDNVNSSNYGPHSSNAANKLDPTVDSDLDGRNNPNSRVGGYGNTQAHDNYGTTTGPGGVGSSDTYKSTTNNPAYNNPQSTNAGPHSSNLMNKMDPRVDSDRDGRNDPSSRVGGYGNTQHAGDSYGQASGPGGLGSSNTGTGYGHSTTHTGAHTGAHTGTSATPAHHVTTGGGYGSNNPNYDNPQSTNAGPHNSNLLNKLDPRVDSDRDNRNDPTSHVGGYGQTQSTHGNTGYAGSNTHTTTHHGGNTHHTGPTGTSAGYDNPQSTNAGPHNSNLLNKLDPRVDSDRDNRNDPTSRIGGYGESQSGYGSNTHTGTGAGVGGLGSSTTHHNTHGHGQGAQGYTGTNTAYDNPQSTNQGPHNSNLLNKLDPRVDSDRDGRDDPTSRTGGYGNTQTGGQRYY